MNETTITKPSNQTVTAVTYPTSIQTVYFLRLKKDSIESVVGGFLNKIEESAILALNHSEKFKEWKKSVFPHLFQKISSEENENNAALALCDLLVTVIYQALREETDYEKGDLIFTFKEELEKILQTLLPKEKNLQEFIRDYQNSLSKLKITGVLAELIKNEIYDSANKTNNELQQTYSYQKQLLNDVNSNLHESAQYTFHQIDRSTSEMNEILDDFSGLTEWAKKIETRMQEELNHAQRLSNNAKEELKRL